MYELVYTSTPAGLISGRSGFATVAVTEGFPPNLIAPVENLSGYKPFFAPGTEHESRNPVNYTCQQFRLGRTPYLVLSRISYAGLSYTGRSNVIAHHLLFLPDELDEIPGGAVSVLRSEENFPPWSGDPRMLPQRKKISHKPLPQGGAMWQKLVGDPKWVQYMVDRFRTDPGKGFAFSFDPLRQSGAEILELAAEMAACMTREELQRFTFSTYCYSSGITNPLFLRSYVNDSVQLGSIRRLDPESVIYLGKENVLPSSWLEKTSPSGEEDPVAEPAIPPLIVEDKPQISRPEPVADQIAVRDAAAPVHEQKQQSPDGPESDLSGEGPCKPNPGKYLILAVICLVVLGLVAVVFWRIFTGSRQPENNSDFEAEPGGGKTAAAVKTSKAPEPAATGRKNTGTAVSSLTSKTAKPGTEHRSGNPEGIPSSGSGRKSGRSAKSVPAPKATVSKTAFGQLTDQEMFDLYRDYYAGMKIKLPKTLQSAEKLELTIRSVGGSKDITSPEKFISGNGSRSVTVYSGKVNRSGLTTRWEPDQDVSGRMIFQLADGFLKITLPSKKGEKVPRKEDVSQIKFLSGRGGFFLFDVRTLPQCVDKIVKRKIKIDIQSEYENVKFYLSVPADLRAFCRFYTVEVNGSDKGEINSTKFPLYELNLGSLGQKANGRDDALEKMLTLKKEEQDYNSDNREKLTTPELTVHVPEMLKEKLDPKLKEAKQVAWKKNENVWQEHCSAVRKILLEETGKTELGEGARKILDGLDDYRARVQAHLECRANLAVIRKRHNASRAEFEKKNSELKKDLETLSPVLFGKVRKILEETNDPRKVGNIIELYQTIDVRERLNDIKVEIVRRNIHE